MICLLLIKLISLSFFKPFYELHFLQSPAIVVIIFTREFCLNKVERCNEIRGFLLQFCSIKQAQHKGF